MQLAGLLLHLCTQLCTQLRQYSLIMLAQPRACCLVVAVLQIQPQTIHTAEGERGPSLPKVYIAEVIAEAWTGVNTNGKRRSQDCESVGRGTATIGRRAAPKWVGTAKNRGWLA